MSDLCANCGHERSLHFKHDAYVPGKCDYGYDLCGCRNFQPGRVEGAADRRDYEAPRVDKPAQVGGGSLDSSAGLLVPADTIEKALYDMDDGAIDAGLTASRKLGALRPDLGLAEHAAVFRAAALAAVRAPKEDEA